jgi:hypothetical protein
MLSTGDGAMSLLPGLPVVLLMRASEQGARNAVDWLRRLFLRDSGTVIHVLPVWGVTPCATIELAETFSLVPFSNIPRAPALDYLLNKHLRGSSLYDYELPTAALLMRRVVAPLIYTADSMSQQPSSPRAADVLHEILRCLTIVGPRTIVSKWEWSQHEDSELALLTAGTQGHFHEIQPFSLRSLGEFDSVVAIEIVRQYFDFDSAKKKQLQSAIERFDRALRRQKSEDAAVELSVALEALLGDGSGELTWKLSLRAAILRGGDKDKKLYARSLVTSLYQLRSDVLHGRGARKSYSVVGTKISASDLVSKGAVIVAEVLRAALLKGTLPSWFEAELGL